MKDAAAFQATYSDWRLIKGRKVVQVVFEVPMEAANEAYQALGGMPNPAAEVWCAIARLVQPAGKGVGVETTNRAQPALGDVPARAPRNKLAQLAGMLSKTPLFHRYLEITNWEGFRIEEEAAAQYIRNYCGVGSRADIIPNTPAEDKFLKLYNDFVFWRDADKFVETA